MSNNLNLDFMPNKVDKRNFSKTKNIECTVCIKNNKKAKQVLKQLIKENVINEFKRCNSFSPNKKKCNISETETHIEKLIFSDWIKYNKEIDQKIGEQILKLLMDIFDKRYALYPNNICSLSEYSLQCQSKLNSICSKFKELSFYMLYKLYDQIIPFYKCLDQKLNFKTITPIEYEDIKEILYYISNDLSEIFKNPLENEEGEDEDEVDEDKYFKLSHILIVMLEDYLIKENKICDKLHLKTKSPLYKAKDNFEKILQLINNIYFINNYESLLKEKLSLVNEENLDKEDEKSSLNIDDENKNNNIKETEDNNEDNKNNKNISIEDLVNFINEPKKNKNKKKHKKKNKNKKKKNEKNNNIKEDIEFLNYKKDIEVYTQNLPYVKKIRPKYSDNFLKTMKLLSQ